MLVGKVVAAATSLEKGPCRYSPPWMCSRCCSLRACATIVVVVVVIVFMLVVHGRRCIMLIFIEVEASEAGLEMAVFFPFKGSKGWRV